MTTPYVEPFLATTNAIISSSDTNAANDNHRHWNELLPEPTAAGQLLISQTPGPGGTGSWVTKPSGDAVLSPGSVTGTGSSSAIGTGSIHQNRLVDIGASLLFGGTGAGTGGATKVGASHIDATNSASDGQVPVWNASASKFTFTTPASVAGVPSGLTAFFQTAMALAAASGWSAFTAPAGRLIACAGTVGGQTWATQTGYGSSWDHVHTSNTFTGSGSGSGSGSTGTDNTGGASATASANFVFPGSDTFAQAHHHAIPSLSVSTSVSTSVSVSGNTQPATVIPYLYALLMAEKS